MRESLAETATPGAGRPREASPPLEQQAPFSGALNRPKRTLPSLACDSHIHIIDQRFKPSSHWPHPVRFGADVAAYRQVQARLGTSRVVIVSSSSYGTDNDCAVDALDQFEGAARGIAVVPQDVSAAELDHLAAHRMCGLRVNFVSEQAWGRTTETMLMTLARKAARLGWHIQLFVRDHQLLALAPVLVDFPVPLVMDHMAGIALRGGLESEAYAVLRRLLDAGNTWVKLSGAFLREGGPTYEETLPLGRALVEAAPERMVWGTDWPHTTEPADAINDATQADQLCDWAGSDALVNRILVENPAKLYGFEDN